MKKQIKQLNELKKLGKELRLAADGWDEDWKTLFATMLSAQTLDKTTIPVAESLFEKYRSVEKLSKAKLRDVEKMIKRVNYHKTKAKHLIESAKILVSDYKGKIPHEFEKLIELPGIGRKTANVFLAEKGHGRIGVDTHVGWISKQLGWTRHSDQKKVEADLEKLFPKRYWGDINWILVRFGQTYKSRREKKEILDRVKRMS